MKLVIIFSIFVCAMVTAARIPRQSRVPSHADYSHLYRTNSLEHDIPDLAAESDSSHEEDHLDKLPILPYVAPEHSEEEEEHELVRRKRARVDDPNLSSTGERATAKYYDYRKTPQNHPFIQGFQAVGDFLSAGI